jgi:hypothetical protein
MEIQATEFTGTYYPPGADDESVGPRAITTAASARMNEEI